MKWSGERQMENTAGNLNNLQMLQKLTHTHTHRSVHTHVNSQSSRKVNERLNILREILGKILLYLVGQELNTDNINITLSAQSRPRSFGL